MFLNMSFGDRSCLLGNSEAFRLHPYWVFRWVTPVWSLMDGRTTWSFMAEGLRESWFAHSPLLLIISPCTVRVTSLIDDPELGSRSERVATPEFWRTYRGPGTSGWPCVSFHKSTGPSQNWQPKNRGVRDKLGQWFTTGQGGLPLLEALFKYTLIYIHSTPPNTTSLKVRVRMYKDKSLKDKSLTSIY